MRQPIHASREEVLARRGQRGFTAIEMVVTLGVLIVVMLGVLAMFDMAGRISRVQVSVADMQGSLRTGQYSIVRLLRMAGRGNLPVNQPQPPAGAATPTWSLPNGVAVAVRNNVPAGTFIDAPANRHLVLAGTDVLTVRGVFNSPVCNVVASSFLVDTTVGSPTYGEGRFVLNSTAMTGVPLPQSLRRLAEAIRDSRPEQLILISPEDDSIYNVVELDPARSAYDDLNNPTQVTVGFRFTGGTHTAAYSGFSGGWIPAMADLAFAGVVEEYRFYIEDLRERAGDPGSPVKPVLMRAQTYPGTQAAYAGNDANWAVPLADDVADLQVALGIDALGSMDGQIDDGVDDAARANDEWLFNSTADDPDPPTGRWRLGRLYYVRVSTTAYSGRRDRDYRSPPNATTEDHTYAVPDLGAAAGNITPDRSYRRRTLRTVVDLRNIT